MKDDEEVLLWIVLVAVICVLTLVMESRLASRDPSRSLFGVGWLPLPHLAQPLILRTRSI